MSSKEPVLLTVLIETACLRWGVAGISLSGDPLPLLLSEPGDLKPYVGIQLDEQVSFLRHRLSGVLQRGCDRLWAKQKKPCHIVFITDGLFTDAATELTERVAAHFVEWMTNPPVVFFTTEHGFHRGEHLPLSRIAGCLSEEYREALETGLAALLGVWDHPDAWENVPARRPPS
ncbi:MAG: hypothetical protein GXY83_25380 [Rhodopirellula sp.]|mgnify:CR=1 FL=1|nr:hypothetical protein [Rhodopirellula sp.]